MSNHVPSSGENQRYVVERFPNTQLPRALIQQHRWEFSGPVLSKFTAALWHSGLVKNFVFARRFDFKR
jgi:hypothetical protein